MEESQKIKKIISNIFTENKIRVDIETYLFDIRNAYEQMQINLPYKKYDNNLWEVMLYDEYSEQEVKKILIDTKKDDVTFISYHFISQEFSGIYYKIRVGLGKFYPNIKNVDMFKIEKCFIVLDYNNDFSVYDVHFFWEDGCNL